MYCTFSKSLFKFNWTSLIDVPFVVRLVSSANMPAGEAIKQFGKIIHIYKKQQWAYCGTPKRIGCWFEIA